MFGTSNHLVANMFFESLMHALVWLRSWSGNANAQKTIGLAMKRDPRLVVTLPHHVKDQSLVEKALEH